MTELGALLDQALASGDDTLLRAELLRRGDLPGGELNLRLVDAFAAAVGQAVVRPNPPVEALEALLDGWAAIPPSEAPDGAPEVILPCAAVAAYGEVGAVRPDWWDDEIAKLRRAATDERRRVRATVALALQRLLDADWDRAAGVLLDWAAADDPLVVRLARMAVSEPRLLDSDRQRATAAEVRRRAADRLGALGARLSIDHP